MVGVTSEGAANAGKTKWQSEQTDFVSTGVFVPVPDCESDSSDDDNGLAAGSDKKANTKLLSNVVSGRALDHGVQLVIGRGLSDFRMGQRVQLLNPSERREWVDSASFEGYEPEAGLPEGVVSRRQSLSRPVLARNGWKLPIFPLRTGPLLLVTKGRKDGRFCCSSLVSLASVAGCSKTLITSAGMTCGMH